MSLPYVLPQEYIVYEAEADLRRTTEKTLEIVSNKN